MRPNAPLWWGVRRLIAEGQSSKVYLRPRAMRLIRKSLAAPPLKSQHRTVPPSLRPRWQPSKRGKRACWRSGV